MRLFFYFFFFFFLMIRRPPRSTLFPSRRSSDPYPFYARLRAEAPVAFLNPRFMVSRYEDRSEEHTSELQSRRDLVCRLLLEKKKKNKQPNPSLPNNNHSQKSE